MIVPSQREQVVSRTLKRLALQEELDELVDTPTQIIPISKVTRDTPPFVPVVATSNLPRIIEYPPPHMQAKYKPASIMAILTEGTYYAKIKVGLIPYTIYLNELALEQYRGEATRTLGDFDGSFHVLTAYGREERIALKLDQELGLSLPVCHVLCVCMEGRGIVL